MQLSWEKVCRLKADLYGFLGNCLLESVQNEGAAYTQHEFWEQYPLKAANPHMKNGLDSLISCTKYLAKLPVSQVSQEIQSEYMVLFLGPGQPKAPPWESVYRTPEKLLFGWPTMEVRESYRQAGFEILRKNQLPEDHMGIELMFLATLSDALAKLISNNGGNGQFVQEIKRQADFISSHPLTWIADFHKDASAGGSIGFYSGLIELTWGTFLWDLELLDEMRLIVIKL